MYVYEDLVSGTDSGRAASANTVATPSQPAAVTASGWDR
jgi:hypothetical protein